MTAAFATLEGSAVEWKSITVSRSLDAFLGSGAVTVALQPGAVRAPGARVNLTASGDGPAETLLTGFVDAVSGGGDANGGEMTLECRDRTADLVDGTRIDASLGWYDSTLLDIARAIAAPYGLAVVDEAGAQDRRLAAHIGQPGETAYAVLERAARLSGVLLSTSPEGRIVLGTPSRERAGGELRTGPAANVLRYDWRNDASQRFRRTQVRGSTGLAGLVAGGAWRLAGIAEDPSIRPQREAVVVAQGDLVGDEVDALARWTVAVARARASTLTVEALGWRVAPGARVWRPGMLVPVSIPEAGISGEFVVAAVELTWDETGERARLGLVAPDAFEIDPTEAQRLRRGSVGAVVQ